MKSLFKKQEIPFTYHKYYVAVQDKWVEKMNILTSGLSRKKLVYLLVVFNALAGSYLIWNMYIAFSRCHAWQVKNTGEISKIKHNNIKK